MTDERIERVRNALGQYAAWGIREGWTMYANAPEALDSLERELERWKHKWIEDTNDLEDERDAARRELTELREAARANTACCESNGCHGNHERLRDALSHYDEVTHG